MNKNSIEKLYQSITFPAESKNALRESILDEIPENGFSSNDLHRKNCSRFILPVAGIAAALTVALVLVLTSHQPKVQTPMPSDSPSTIEESIQPVTLYDPLLVSYRNIVESKDKSFQSLEENEMSTLCLMLDSISDLGYCLADIDGNDIPELIISNGDVLYDVYTIQDGTICHVLSGAERNVFTLCTGGIIANRGSNSAAATDYFFLRLQGANLIQEQVLYFDASENEDDPWFLGFGREKVSAAEAQAVLDSYHRIALELEPFPG